MPMAAISVIARWPAPTASALPCSADTPNDVDVAGAASARANTPALVAVVDVGVVDGEAARVAGDDRRADLDGAAAAVGTRTIAFLPLKASTSP